MSFGWTAATWLAIGAGVGAAGSLYSAANGADAARHSSNMAKDAAKVNATLSDEATNRANARAPDTAAQMAANVLAGKSGQSGTMLTGPQGVDNSSLSLGGNTLLGGAKPPGS